MTRTPLPPSFDLLPCDPCRELRAKNKIQGQIISGLLDLLKTKRAIVKIRPNASSHYVTLEVGKVEVSID